MTNLAKLIQGKQFSGLNGAFTGTVIPRKIEGNTLSVTCEKDGSSWEEDWNLQHVIWAFERGDYYFLND